MSIIDRIRERLFGVRLPDGYANDLSRSIKSDSENGEMKSQPVQNESQLPEQNAGTSEFPGRVLFVCSGNICRSPYGAARFVQLAAGRDVQVISAGTLRLVGRTAAPEMIATAKENGLDLESHRSSALSRMIIQASDVIFVMENAHKREIVRICPEAEKRVVLVGNWLPDPKDDVTDPMGREPEVYRAVAHEIDIALARWFEQWTVQD